MSEKLVIKVSDIVFV